jgi:hypothetical protein
MLLAPALAGGAYVSFAPRSFASRRLACESPSAASGLGTHSFGTRASPTARATSSKPIIDPHQFATGSIIGIFSGMLLQRLGRIFFIIVGGGYLVLRALGASELIPELPWRRAKQFILNRTTGRDPNAPITSSPLMAALTKDLTFKVCMIRSQSTHTDTRHLFWLPS